MIKRPLVIITISYIIGIIIGLYFKINTALFVILCLIIIVIVYEFFSKYFHSRAKFDIGVSIGVIIAILLSFFVTQFKENKFSSVYNDISTEAVINGIVVEIQDESVYYENYTIKVNSINDNSKYKNTNILLKVKKNKRNTLEYGDNIIVHGVFEEPAVRTNFKGFNYANLLKTKNIYMICKSDYNSISIIKKKSVFVGDMWINNIQNKVKTNLNEILNENNSNIANAILLGSSSSITQEQRQMFSDSSLIHVLAISGMHVTYVVLFWSFVLKKTDKRKTKYFLIIFLIFFSFLTGGSPSVLRATIMSCVSIISKLVYRKADTINNIAISCLFILVINPYDILNFGFQLSFLGTLGIVLFNSKITGEVQKLELIINKKSREKSTRNATNKLIMHVGRKILGSIKSIIILGISANILMIPVLVYSYNTFSLTFIISTILVTHILGIMMLSGYLTVIISLFSIKFASIIGVVFNLFINIFNYIAEFSSKISFLRFTVVTPNFIEIIFYYSLVFYFFLFYKKKHNKSLLRIFAFFVLSCILFNVLKFDNNKLRIHFIDVGQGDSCLIITETNKTILIDGGGSESDSYDIGEKILVPYLLDRKIRRIDYMVFSHFDSDHCKGLFVVMEKLNVKNAIISEQGVISDNYECFIKLANSKNVNVIKVKAGNRLKIDKSTYIDVLWPRDNLINENILNNNSIVCKLNYNNLSILFTGDIEEIAEKKMVELYGSNVLKSTILKVAHHGSKTSSIQDFVANVNPQIALIGVGKNNKFGHPSNKVIERLENMRCTCL